MTGPYAAAEPPLDERLELLSVLAEPVRRRLFLRVANSAEPVGRDAAASAVGISRGLAAFHLDRLQEAGLLSASFQARTEGGRVGRGRPTKVYRLADDQIDLSIPVRQYELAAGLFADALAAIERPAALDVAARDEGRRLGGVVRERAGEGADQARLVREMEAVLAERGYRPHWEAASASVHELCLGSCPFAAVATRHQDLVCPTTQVLLDGLLEAAGIDELETRLEPAVGRCCVVMRPLPTDEAGGRVAAPAPQAGS